MVLGTAAVSVVESVGGLRPTTAYRYRVTASNSAGGPILGSTHLLTTQEATSVPLALDRRGWELVSPLDKGGGAVQGPEQNFGGGVFQAASDGESITYSSADSFGAAPQGAPAASQYESIRGSGGWGSEDLTPPSLSGSYGDEPDGVPYQLFSADLARGLLSNGERCRGMAGGECPVANPPLPGTGAPAGYRDYYLRQGGGGFQSLLSTADMGETGLGSDQFELDFAAASPDLRHVVLSSCAALTSNATEASALGGCDPAAQNLYAGGSGSGLTLINVLPGDTQGTPGAAVAAQGYAVSADGSRVYWREGGSLYLREGVQTSQVDESLGGGGSFQTASSDGRFAFFTKNGHLYRYDAASRAAVDLAPGGQVQGVLGASADGSRVYYLNASGLFLWSGGITTKVAAEAAASNYPPTTGTARVSPDGEHLAFLSSAELTGYESNGASEVFLYGPPPGGGAPGLTCVSCNPTGERPRGSSSIPGAVANGFGPDATRVYKPRLLSDDGRRVFFDSGDKLVVPDSGAQTDVYEWEAFGVGDCPREGGCVALISGGRGSQPSQFIDASSDGSDVFFLTDDSLVANDPGSFDIYDAREGGGFPLPEPLFPCKGDACQSLPAPPEDPAAGTLVRSTGNPPLRFLSSRRRKGKHGKKHHRKKKHHSHRRRGGRR
jgi:hypothetical protein